MSAKPKDTKPSIAEIEARIARARLEMTATVDEVSDRVNPKVQVEKAKASAQRKVKTFTEDLKAGKPAAVAVVAGGVALVGGGITLAILAARR